MGIKRKKSSARRFLESIAGPITLYSLVDALREGEGWNKREMAEALEVSPTYYSDFVAGNKPVSPQKAASWATALGYDEQQFVKLALQDQLRAFSLIL